MTAPITYVFNVPKDASMIGVVWQDETDYESSNDVPFASFVFKEGYTLQ
ncbi:MAG: hypothetical protein LKI93_04595 [Bifidobacteriaceae bacterium]|jgi:hypothetical protein|nr:hypothetical protein [Bifidobacteriaceae bacterium]